MSDDVSAMVERIAKAWHEAKKRAHNWNDPWPVEGCDQCLSDAEIMVDAGLVLAADALRGATTLTDADERRMLALGRLEGIAESLDASGSIIAATGIRQAIWALRGAPLPSPNDSALPQQTNDGLPEKKAVEVLERLIRAAEGDKDAAERHIAILQEQREADGDLRGRIATLERDLAAARAWAVEHRDARFIEWQGKPLLPWEMGSSFGGALPQQTTENKEG